MSECVACGNEPKFTDIEGGNYYCGNCILALYGIESEGQ